MKNTVFIQSRSTGRLQAAFSFCRHGLLALCAATALSLQAGESNERVTMGGTVVLGSSNFGPSANCPTPLTATTVINGYVSPNVTSYTVNSNEIITNLDQIGFTLAEGHQITGVNVLVTNYNAPAGNTASGLNVRIVQGMVDLMNQSFTGNTDVDGSDYSLVTSPVGAFALQVTAPTGIQNEAEATTGSASYVITLTISNLRVPITELAGDYIGLVQSNLRVAQASRIAQIVNPPPSEFKSIPNEALNARLQMKVTSTGAVSGRMTFGPTAILFKSSFVVTTGTTLPKLVIPIPAYNRSLVLNFQTGERAGYIDGSLVQQGMGEGDLWDDGDGVQGWKNTWSRTKLPSNEITSYKTFSIGNSFRIIGPAVRTESFFESKDSPRGTSFGWVKEGAALGNYQSAGTLADGEKFTSTGFYGPRGDFLIYQYLYASRGRGSLVGIAQLLQQEIVVTPNLAPVPTRYPIIQGQVLWLKQPSPPVVTSVAGSGPPKKYASPTPRRSITTTDTLYPNGFRLGFMLNGSAYRTPTAGEVLNVNGNRISGLLNGIETGINFDDDEEYGVSFGTRLTVRSQGATSTGSTMTANAGTYMGDFGSSYNNLVISCNTATGLFSGRFQARPPLRTIAFQGIFVYNGEGTSCAGLGFFIGNRFTSSDMSTLIMTPQRNSGNVYIGNINQG